MTSSMSALHIEKLAKSADAHSRDCTKCRCQNRVSKQCIDVSGRVKTFNMNPCRFESLVMSWRSVK